MSTKVLPADLTIRALGDEADITITTPHTDLMADTIDPMGMDVSRYLAGTRAVNFAHDHGRLPVGKTVSLSKTPQGIRARFRWLDANPEARVVRDVFAEGVLGASVEFVPVERAPNRSAGTHFSKSVLTGWALTGNPANPECVRMMKSLGLTGAGAPVVVVTEDDEDDQITFEPQDLVAAVRTVVARQSRLGCGDEPIVFVLDDEPAAEEATTYLVDEAEVKAAVESFVAERARTLRRMVDHEVTRQVNYLRGRVD